MVSAAQKPPKGIHPKACDGSPHGLLYQIHGPTTLWEQIIQSRRAFRRAGLEAYMPHGMIISVVVKGSAHMLLLLRGVGTSFEDTEHMVPKMAPRWAQVAPTWPPNAPHMAPNGSKMSPRRAQDSPKMGPKALQEGPQIGLGRLSNTEAEK